MLDNQLGRVQSTDNARNMIASSHLIHPASALLDVGSLESESESENENWCMHENFGEILKFPFGLH